jgi:hypothetical protein
MTTATTTHGWAEDAEVDIQMIPGWRLIDPSGVAVVAGGAEAEIIAGTTFEIYPLRFLSLCLCKNELEEGLSASVGKYSLLVGRIV